MTTFLIASAAYLAVSVVGSVLFTAAIRRGDRQHRAEMAQLMQARGDKRLNTDRP